MPTLLTNPHHYEKGPREPEIKMARAERLDCSSTRILAQTSHHVDSVPLATLFGLTSGIRSSVRMAPWDIVARRVYQDG
jgi:hypothetical protein